MKFAYLYGYNSSASIITPQRSPNGIVDKVLDCNIIVCEFEFQLTYSIHFWFYVWWEMYKHPFPTSNGLNGINSVLLDGRLWYKITNDGWYVIKQRNQTKRNVAYSDELYNPPTTTLHKGKTASPQRVSWVYIKQSDCEVPVMLKLWAMRSIPSLPSLSHHLSTGVRLVGPYLWVK